METAPSGPAVAWSATIGLVPGYGRATDPATAKERRSLLVRLWTEAMEDQLAATGMSVSAIIIPSTVLYPVSFGCPDGGECAMTLSGSSNPAHVGPDDLDRFMDAVESTVGRVQAGMEQTTVRIEFSILSRSVLSRRTAPSSRP